MTQLIDLLGLAVRCAIQAAMLTLYGFALILCLGFVAFAIRLVMKDLTYDD